MYVLCPPPSLLTMSANRGPLEPPRKTCWDVADTNAAAKFRPDRSSAPGPCSLVYPLHSCGFQKPPPHKTIRFFFHFHQWLLPLPEFPKKRFPVTIPVGEKSGSSKSHKGKCHIMCEQGGGTEKRTSQGLLLYSGELLFSIFTMGDVPFFGLGRNLDT